MGDGLEVRVRGLREVERALRDLPGAARRDLLRSQRLLAEDFARLTRQAGYASSRQAARAASTVRALYAGGTPGVRGGPHPLLFLSEFGMNRHTGWYARPRYNHSRGRQARPHTGSNSYWFFRTIQANQSRVTRESRELSERIISDWSA